MSQVIPTPDFATRATDEMPFGAIFVVDGTKDEEGNIAAERDILQASTNALVQLLTSDNDIVKEAVEAWFAGRIRKIVKRASGAAWRKADALDLPHFVQEHNGARVMVFLPILIADQPKALKSLQVTGLNSADADPQTFENAAYLEVIVNDTLEMSTGKVVAQVGHAVQLFLTYGNDMEVQDWIANDTLIQVVRSKNMDESAVTGIVVRDAGFTEVPSGSLTAYANYRFKKLEG